MSIRHRFHHLYYVRSFRLSIRLTAIQMEDCFCMNPSLIRRHGPQLNNETSRGWAKPLSIRLEWCTLSLLGVQSSRWSRRSFRIHRVHWTKYRDSLDMVYPKYEWADKEYVLHIQVHYASNYKTLYFLVNWCIWFAQYFIIFVSI